jgi:hypothetical protein
LLGVVAGPYGPTGTPTGIEVVHVLGVIVVIAGPLIVGVRIVRSMWHPAGTTGASSASEVMDLLLTFGFVGDLSTFIVLPITSSDGYARYLVCGVVFGAILTARVLVRYVAMVGQAVRRGVLGVAIMVAALFGVGVALELRGAPAANPAAELTAYLGVHHLTHGVGDYWSSSLVTVDSGGTVAVRPVIADQNGDLVRYDKQSAASWYSGQRFQFVVFNRAVPWNGVDAKAARKTYGRPLRVSMVGTYEVITWPRRFAVGVLGSAGP